jgi:hypothetical protein
MTAREDGWHVSQNTPSDSNRCDSRQSIGAVRSDGNCRHRPRDEAIYQHRSVWKQNDDYKNAGGDGLLSIKQAVPMHLRAIATKAIVALLGFTVNRNALTET